MAVRGDTNGGDGSMVVEENESGKIKMGKKK